MKKIINLLSLVLLGFCVIQASFAQTKTNNNVQLLFIQTAETATISANNNQPGVYKLKLDQVRPYITYFSDRPHRITGVLPLEKYLADWSKGEKSFKQDNPNAGIISATFDAVGMNGIQTDVLELSHPQYNKMAKTLIYTVKTIGKIKAIQVGTYHDVSLFIDTLDCPLCALSGPN